MSGAWGRSFGGAWGGAWGGATVPIVTPGAGGLQGWPVRIPQPLRRRKRRVRERSDLLLLGPR